MKRLHKFLAVMLCLMLICSSITGMLSFADEMSVAVRLLAIGTRLPFAFVINMLVKFFPIRQWHLFQTMKFRQCSP